MDEAGATVVIARVHLHILGSTVSCAPVTKCVHREHVIYLDQTEHVLNV